MTRPGVDSPRSHSIHDASSLAGSGAGFGNSSFSMRWRVATYAPNMSDSSGWETHVERGRDDAPLTDRIPETWRRLLFGRSSFVPVLALAILVIVTAPVLDEWKFGYVLVFPFSAVLVILTFLRSGTSRRFVVLAASAIVFVGVVVIALSVARSVDWGQDRYLVATSSFLFAALMAIAFPAVVRQAFTHRRVDLNTLAAGITAYLLIGIFFASMYRAVSALEGYHLFKQSVHPASGDYTYFSFITLTTVGYGDFTPGTDTARSLAIAEAIMGQIFLVTAVARIMSLFGTERPTSRTTPARRTFDDEAD